MSGLLAGSHRGAKAISHRCVQTEAGSRIQEGLPRQASMNPRCPSMISPCHLGLDHPQGEVGQFRIDRGEI